MHAAVEEREECPLGLRTLQFRRRMPTAPPGAPGPRINDPPRPDPGCFGLRRRALQQSAALCRRRPRIAERAPRETIR